MMLAAAYGGLAIGNTGCAVAHNIGHALGSLAQVPHGRAVSVALAQTMEWAIDGNRSAFDRVGNCWAGEMPQMSKTNCTNWQQVAEKSWFFHRMKNQS